MSFYTLKHKTMQCPLWPTKVRITGKYRIREDDKSAYFTGAECEIVRNLHLPKMKKNKNLELYAYCNYNNCPCLKDFPKDITLL